MAKGRASSSAALARCMIAAISSQELGAAVRGDEEGHPAARHPAEHQEPPEVVAQRRPGLADDRLGELVADPGDDPLERPFPVPRRQPADGADVGRLDGLDDRLEDLERLLRGPAIRRGSASRYFSVTMFRIGPTFCAIPPWTRTRLSASASWNVGRRGGAILASRRAVEEPDAWGGAARG